MTIDQAKQIHALLEADLFIEGANYALDLIGKPHVETKQQGIKVCQRLFQQLLDNDMYLEAGTLQWGPQMFNTEPESTIRVFKALNESARILLMGASSMSKTYAAGGYYLLDYLRDPWYTSVKLSAVNEDHLKKNLFAHVATLYRACAIPSPHEIVVQDAALWIGVKEAGNEFGISGLAFRQSQTTSGQFKGYKAKPVRKRPHPKFGYMGRLRVLGDEGQNWPGGPFKDFNSLMASISGADLIKIAVAFNPEDVAVEVVKMAEPVNGWSADQLDKMHDYTSKSGWRVCRLDAAICENVIQKRVIYPGLQTYEGFMSYLTAGGDNSPNYWCFARGMPPMVGTVNTVIPPAWPQSQRGEAIFIEPPQNCAAADLAFMGKDSAQMAVGRWGLASGWRDYMGNEHKFADRLNVAAAKPRHVRQIDSIMPLTKHDDTVRMAEEIMARAKMLQIPPEWVAVDATGYGLGVASHLKKVWGDVLAIAWNQKATERKIVAESIDGAHKECDGVMSEMWWAFRRWLDPACCAIIFSPIVPTYPIQSQLTSRRYKNWKNGIKVEAKEEYMARHGGESPDEADGCVMLVHVVRHKSEVIPGLVEEHGKPKNTAQKGEMRFTSVGEMVSSEEDDSICESGLS